MEKRACLRLGLVLALVGTLAVHAPAEARAATAATAATAAAEPTFSARVLELGPNLRARMRESSWRRGCPVGLDDLRLLILRRFGMDGEVHKGRLVVHEDQARRIVRVMRRLFELRFPIRRMRLIDAYDGSDSRSMRANNTSAFNCRYVAGTTRWSQHAYGRAIDVNPVQNPYVNGDYVSPARGERYADRSLREPGMIHAGGGVVRAFEANGWKWGGYWSGAKDYQHFSRNGH